MSSKSEDAVQNQKSAVESFEIASVNFFETCLKPRNKISILNFYSALGFLVRRPGLLRISR